MPAPGAEGGRARASYCGMRAIWKGAVSFGLVNVPVRLYSATENHDVQFRQVHREDGGRIRYKRICSVDGAEVSFDDIAKGFETEDGQMVVLTDDDFAHLPAQSSKEIAVEKFVPGDQIDPMLLDKSYYLEPDKSAAVLRVRDGVIVMQTMLWPDEVRSPEFANLGDEVHATEKELAMAHLLVDSLAGDYDPDDYEDDYAAAVQAVVEAKVSGGEVTEVPTAGDSSGEVVDLLEALQRSVDRAKAARGEAAAS